MVHFEAHFSSFKMTLQATLYLFNKLITQPVEDYSLDEFFFKLLYLKKPLVEKALKFTLLSGALASVGIPNFIKV
jgi:hypothetical protein